MASARNFFSEEEKLLLLNAIEKAELNTSGEIRVHVENYCLGNPLHAARRIFKKLGMYRTDERNGVLFYIAVKSRKIAVWGDEGIHQKLGEGYWNEIMTALVKDFKADNKAASLADAIQKCGKALSTYFPRSTNDKNELSNDLSF